MELVLVRFLSQFGPPGDSSRVRHTLTSEDMRKQGKNISNSSNCAIILLGGTDTKFPF